MTDATTKETFTKRKLNVLVYLSLQCLKLYVIELMGDHWKGCKVSLKQHTTNHWYQGEISAVTTDSITLQQPYRNCIPCNEHEITFSVQEIDDLKLIEPKNPQKSNVHLARPTPRHAIPDKASRAAVVDKFSETGPAKNTISGNSVNRASSRRKPFIQANISGKKRFNIPTKNEECFDVSVGQFVDNDFDFEKNLALFDKQAVRYELQHGQQQPDVIRQADKSYRHDENVITPSETPVNQRQIIVHEGRTSDNLFLEAPEEYVTDDGVVVPAITLSLHRDLWRAADSVGITWERRLELFSRAATDICIQLLGGGRRLVTNNAHQWPTVVILCGTKRNGAIGTNTARLLASHGIKTVLYNYSINSAADPVNRTTLNLYRLTGNPLVNTIEALKTAVTHPDLILLALAGSSDEDDDDSDNSNDFYEDLAQWTNQQRAIMLAIDPPISGTPGNFNPKYSIVPVLPLTQYSSHRNGALYLCNLAFPKQLFQRVGIEYRPPFGPKSVIRLYPRAEF